MTTLSTQPYKGTRDFFPEDMRLRRWMFGRLRQTVESFGFEEYDGPMLEPFELYAAKTGEEIVNQQLYWLMDRGERKVAVRPEMTPTLARMVAQKIHELPRPIRWFSIPNLWRYERPQRGRLREHWQLNVDVLGGDAVAADAEVLTLALELMRAFGGERFVVVRVNNRRLMDHFFSEVLGLSSDKALGVTKALDSRAKIGEEAYAKWLEELGVGASVRAKMEAFFKSSFEEIERAHPCPGTQELGQVLSLVREAGFGEQVVFDPTVLRGMDYYTGTVFEIFDTSPENRRALFGGGRYDNLVGLFGNHQLPGVGFGMGDVGLQNFLEVHGLLPKLEDPQRVFVTLPSIALRARSEGIARDLRGAGFKAVTPLAVGGFGAQLKQAVKLGARFAVLLGDDELKQGAVAVKDLAKQEQATVPVAELAAWLRSRLSPPSQ